MVSSTSSSNQPPPTFDLNDPDMYNGSNAAYWFMALLASAETTVTGAQECDRTTGLPLSPYAIDPNLILVPTKLNEAFKQAMLIPPSLRSTV